MSVEFNIYLTFYLDLQFDYYIRHKFLFSRSSYYYGGSPRAIHVSVGDNRVDLDCYGGFSKHFLLVGDDRIYTQKYNLLLLFTPCRDYMHHSPVYCKGL